jgi:hypothetical protein
MQHFQPYAADTFACGADAVGRRNSALDADPNITTCLQCKNTDTWRAAWENRTKTAQEIRTDRFLAARDKTKPIPYSQYVALVDGKVRMGLTTYEALAAAATPDDQSSPAKPVTHHYDPGYYATACGKQTRDVKRIDSRWGMTTCPDCLSYYRPENDPLAPKVEREDGPDYALADQAPDDRSSAGNRHAPAPRFKHDCNTCIYLGSETVGGHLHDLYFHPDTSHPSVIARESSEPGDYRSGLSFVDRDGALALAYIRAQRRGLL